MSIFKRGVSIRKAIAGRVKRYPVVLDEPKKKMRRWIVCPNLMVHLPKMVNAEAVKKDYAYSVQICSANSSQECREMLDYMIDLGQEEIESGNKRLWLHATKYSVRHEGIYRAELKYIFRVRQLPEEIL